MPNAADGSSDRLTAERFLVVIGKQQMQIEEMGMEIVWLRKEIHRMNSQNNDKKDAGVLEETK